MRQTCSKYSIADFLTVAFMELDGEDGEALTQLHVVGLDGSSLDFGVPESMTALEVVRMIKAQLPEKPGARIQLHGAVAEVLEASNKRWMETPGADVTLTYAF